MIQVTIALILGHNTSSHYIHSEPYEWIWWWRLKVHKKQSFYIFDDKEHDILFVQIFLLQHWTWLINQGVRPQHHIVWSDGCVGQFKGSWAMNFVACYLRFDLKLGNELALFWDMTWEGGMGWCRCYCEEGLEIKTIPQSTEEAPRCIWCCAIFERRVIILSTQHIWRKPISYH
jgi:hypothetical protein